MSNVREFNVSNEAGRNVAEDERPVGSWASVMYLACKEVRKRLIHQLVAVAVVLVLGIATAYVFGMISGSPSGSPPVSIALNVVFLICIVALPRTSAWASGELSDVGRVLPSDGHIAFLKTLPLTSGQIVAARALTAASSVLILLTVFLGSFYALSEPLRDQLGVDEFLLFALFWLGCSLLFEAFGLFTEMGLRGLAGFLVYMVLGALSGGVVGGYGGLGVNVVSLVIELIQSRGAFPEIAVLTLGSISLGLSWLATTWRLNRKGIGS